MENAVIIIFTLLGFINIVLKHALIGLSWVLLIVLIRLVSLFITHYILNRKNHLEMVVPFFTRTLLVYVALLILSGSLLFMHTYCYLLLYSKLP